jgi:8-oxo-dGTP pyrophosphatase MutT (NUDIX family)
LQHGIFTSADLEGFTARHKRASTDAMNLKGKLIRFGMRLVFRPYARIMRGMTLGSRVAVIDDHDRVLLVKPSYSQHWILPGGGIERGETAEFAALRELKEEAGIRATGPLKMLGIYSNHVKFPGDHLICYELRDFVQDAWAPDSEIEAARFFARADLPSNVNDGSRKLIDQILLGTAPSLYWSEE